MAIAFDASSGSATNGTTSKTVSHTCSASATALFVSVVGDTAADRITGVTYNGVAMTLVNNVAPSTRWIYLFYLASPSSGANNIVASASASVYVGVAAASYTGTSITTQPEANNTNFSVGAATSLGTSVTVATANAWLVMAGKSTAAGLAGGAGTTFRTGDGFGGGTGIAGIFDSNGALGAGSQTLTYTANSEALSAVVAAIAPASSATPIPVFTNQYRQRWN